MGITKFKLKNLSHPSSQHGRILYCNSFKCSLSFNSMGNFFLHRAKIKSNTNCYFNAVCYLLYVGITLKHSLFMCERKFIFYAIADLNLLILSSFSISFCLHYYIVGKKFNEVFVRVRLVSFPLEICLFKFAEIPLNFFAS